MEHNDNNMSIISKIFKYIALSSGLLLIAVICKDLSSNIDNNPLTFLDNSEYNHIESLGRQLYSEENYFTSPIIEYKIKDFLSYKGNWSSSEIDFFDKRTSGETNFYIYRYFSNIEQNREKIIIKYFMFDGKFEDKTIGAFSFAYIPRNDSINDTLVVIPDTFNSQVEYRENFERVFIFERISY
jgi:hypothetical protein